MNDAENQLLPSIDNIDLSKITATDLRALDTKKLKQVMVQSIYILEAALFSQASSEHNRIQELRGSLQTLERSLSGKVLDTDQELRYHGILSRNLEMSLNYLVKLHSSVAEGMESLGAIESQLEAQVDNKIKTVDLDHTSKSEIVDLIKNKIKSKLAN